MLPTPKSVMVFSASTSNAGTAAGTFDTRGYDYVVIDVIEQTSNNVTNNCSVLKVAESDATENFTNVPGLVGDDDFTIANSNTSVPQVAVQWRVDLRGRKRYLQVSASPVTTQVLTCIAHLHRAAETPVVAAAAGAAVLVAV